MRKKFGFALVAVGAFTAALAGLGGDRGTVAEAPTCPSALGAACGPVGLVIGTACYTPLPEIPTMGPVTINIDETRIVSCWAL